MLQFAEGLTDRQAADAVRGRIDWKYLLGLELADPGLDASVLCEFRARVIAGRLEEQFLIVLLDTCKTHGWLKARGRQRTDSTHVLALLRDMSRLELVGETLRAALNSLAVVAPEWLKQQVATDWFDRYSHRVENYRLPRQLAAQQQLALTIGADGSKLLDAIYAETAPAVLRHAPAVEVLRRVWLQQYVIEEGQRRWRVTEEQCPSARRIRSPYETQARYSVKRDTEWVGYKAHLTETCDDAGPHLITNVETSVATTVDGAVVAAIHQKLANKQLLPAAHLMDSGYVDAGVIVEGQQQGIDVYGPVHADTTVQKRAGTGFDVSCFVVDWAAKRVRCPKGKISRDWRPHKDRHGNKRVQVRFGRTDCLAYEARGQCSSGSKTGRQLALKPQEQFEALQKARQRQSSVEFKQKYAKRSGIEGTISEGVRVAGLRRCRYRGAEKTHLQHVLIAVALNIGRLVAWWQQELEGTIRKVQPSHFAALA